jgi:hypothetical protein
MQQQSKEDQIPPGWTLKSSSSSHAAPGAEFDWLCVLVTAAVNLCGGLSTNSHHTVHSV